MTNKRNRQSRRNARLPTGRSIPQTGAQILRKIVNTGYSESGASFKKGTMAGWCPTRSSPQSDIDMNLPTLRARSADAVMSIPLASSAINTSRTHVIGAGLKLSPKPKYKLLGITPEQAKEWARITKEEFDLWANSEFCDLLKKNNWYDMQDIAYQCCMIDGDSFAAFKYREPLPGMPYMLRVQLFEASRVCNPGSMGLNSPWTVTIKNPDNGNRIINGVEVDDDGAIVAYWICNRYPYDPTNMQIPQWVRVEVFGKTTGQLNILQICHDERPETYRGVPYLAPVLEVLKQVGRYTEAELTAAIIKSFFSLFFEESYANNGNFFPLQDAFNRQDRVSLDPNAFELGSGTMNVLPPGYKVTTVDTSRSLSTYEAFSNQLIRQIGATLEQPYEVLLKSFNSSYSASRAALLQAWAAFKIRRIWFVRDFCQPSYEVWLTEAVAIGRVKAPGFFTDPIKRKAWANAEWYGPVMGSVDPVKEVNAAALRVKYGFSTREKETAEMTGTNFDENVESLAIEEQTLRDAGLAGGMEVDASSDKDLLEQEQQQQKGGHWI